MTMRMILQKTVNKIKIFLILFIIFLSNGIVYSQSIEKIKNVDTVYVFFDKNKKNTIRDITMDNEQSEFYKNYVMYRFNPDPMNIISFASNTYKDFDNMRNGIKNDERIEKKSFLKKNKDIIIDVDFFAENGFKKTFFALYKKTIYVIDKDDIKGRKIKVKQVRMSCSTCFEE